ncbi:glycosyltransferase family 2 protein [Flavonifractor plautii]|jgi:glycosyltransferases involved in cell wall biogenesis|uniref:glycosyltransferase family 2 protein n=1 Tax=Flavonifractor plautii TaxID=292800 RepID=UPI0023302F53|nr:glycosyltransferase [Flavonifractor plautii]MDB7955592.1 glycosyltransferase [Flavonifractor plautii]
MCKVSVLVPIFNAQPYLRECLGSILNQSLRELEIICINDGSTDGSLDILHAYQQKDRRIQIISQENAGYGHAINAGLRVARGEYIGIVEADDYISSDMYQILWKTAHRHSLDMVKGDYSYFADRDGQRRFDRVMICPELNWYCKKLAPFRTPRLLDADMMNVTGLYRRTFLIQHHIRLRETPGAAFQDTGLWFQIFSQAKTCMFIPRSLYYIRRDNPNSSVMAPHKFHMICEEYDALDHFLAERREITSGFAPYLFRRRVFAYQFMLSLMSPEGQWQVLLRLSQQVAQARQDGIYNPELFTKRMNLFLEQAAQWDGTGCLPVYKKSPFLWVRISDCLREHGVTYAIRRLKIKLGLQQEIF